MASIQLPFIENQGQVDPEVAFYAKTFAGTLFVTGQGLIYTLISDTSSEETNSIAATQEDLTDVLPGDTLPVGSLRSIAIRERFVTPQGLHPAGVVKNDATVNYYVGSRDRWRSNIPTYDGIRFGEVWPDIDVELRAYGNNVEKSFKVKPGGRVDDIKLTFEGVERIEVSDEAQLLLETELGTIAMTRPLAFQDIDGRRQPVEVSYRIDGNSYGFTAMRYEPGYALVIDPLIASTLAGGTGLEFMTNLVVDNAGDIIVTGTTDSSTFSGSVPIEAFHGTPGGFDFDIFAAKFTPTLALIAYTFVGGSAQDAASFSTIDGEGNLFLTGSIGSSDFATTDGSTLSGGADIGLVGLDNNLNMGFAVLVGGNGGLESGFDLALDSQGDVILTGFTNSSDFPVGTTPRGNRDIFVVRLDSPPFGSNASPIELASTREGGSNIDTPAHIVLDEANNRAYLTGVTRSGGWLSTTGSTFGQSYGGGEFDGILMRFDLSTLTLQKAAYKGGANRDTTSAIVLDNGGVGTNLYVAGWTDSTDFLPACAINNHGPLGGNDFYIMRSDENFAPGTCIAARVGGSDSDFGFAVVRGSAGDVFGSGSTNSPDFPTTPGAYDTSLTLGNQKAFVIRLPPDLSANNAATFLGGQGSVAQGAARVVDGAGDVYLIGRTNHTDFPTTVGAFQTAYQGGLRDGFISILDCGLTALTPQERIDLLVAEVQALAQSGALNQGQSTALNTLLDLATQRLNMGNTNGAIGELNGFIGAVSGIVSPGQAQPLIDEASSIITQLEDCF